MNKPVAPEDPTTPLLNRWNAEPSKAAELKKILSNPVYEEALLVLMETMMPQTGAGSRPDLKGKALQMAAMEGFSDCLRNLRRLTDIPEPLKDLGLPFSKPTSRHPNPLSDEQASDQP